MNASKHKTWLEDTRKFWDAGTEFEARYRRICSSPDFNATEDEEKSLELWEQETSQAIPMILNKIPIKSDWTCVEIGCGIGRLLKPIAKMSGKVIGFDLSEKMAAWSKDYLSDVPNAEVRVNDGRSLPGIEDGSVDFVYSHLAFQHITLFEVVEDYLKEIARVLKPGGYCRIQNWRDAHKPVYESIKDVVRPLLGRETYRSSRCWTWSEGKKVKFGGVTFHPRDWRKLLRSHGLQPVDIKVGMGHGFWMWITCVREEVPNLPDVRLQ